MTEQVDVMYTPLADANNPAPTESISCTPNHWLYEVM
jgi:hypothetical protein